MTSADFNNWSPRIAALAYTLGNTVHSPAVQPPPGACKGPLTSPRHGKRGILRDASLRRGDRHVGVVRDSLRRDCESCALRAGLYRHASRNGGNRRATAGKADGSVRRRRLGQRNGALRAVAAFHARWVEAQRSKAHARGPLRRDGQCRALRAAAK